MQDDSGIGWLAIPYRRLKVDLFGGLDRVVIEAVAQAAHDAHYAEAAGSLQNNFQENFAFNPQTPGLLSIDGSWLGKDFGGQHFGRGF